MESDTQERAFEEFGKTKNTDGTLLAKADIFPRKLIVKRMK
jgi:hypothetical protein